VKPLAQLLIVPRPWVASGEYTVLSCAEPRAGPWIAVGVNGVTRRLKVELGT
jgi:hypothetical protein